jgi:uncharacterized protein YdaL
MKSSRIVMFACVLALAFGMAAKIHAAPIRALVLYDQPASGPYQKLGLAYAIMLRNLLGHWDTSVDLLPVASYAAGQVEQYQATFYLGSYYDLQVPAAFLTDVFNTQKTVVWFKYNVWQLAWNPAFTFNQKYGIAFQGLRGLNGAPSPANPVPGFFDTVNYKSRSLVKYYAYDSGSGTVNADPDVGVTQVVDPVKAQMVVPVRNPQTSEEIPYVIRSGNFWYMADIPLSYIGPRDRYLVICDILHDILGVSTPPSKRALVRLEDVGALVTAQSMRTLSDYLSSKAIPFSIAAIPFYRDPLGEYNGGVAQEIHLAQATRLKNALNYARARGGKIVMHGYTHQYNSMRNPHSAVSGDDFEFWDIVNNRSIAEDSTAYVTGRLTAGLAEFAANGYTVFAWEPPHYQMSPTGYRAAAQVFPKTYQRAVYYTSDNPSIGNGDFAVGQFFPYIIQSDYYGQRVIPENLGNIEYDISDIDPTSNFNYTWQDLLLNAENAQVVRDGFASFFFHPFWLEPDIGKPGFQDFQSLIQGIEALGYGWVDASAL